MPTLTGTTRAANGGRLILLARLLFVAAAALFFLAGGPARERDAGAIDGTAGAIPVTVNKTLDGQGITASAVAPEGTLIYEIAVHLCINGSDVRNVYDFGFQGRKCVNTSVGGSDVEQKIAYPNGSQTAEIPYFKLGLGTVRWVNSRGYDQEISCNPGAPCDVVVQLQVTNATVHYQAPICFDAVCAEGTVGWSPPPPPPPATAPPANEPAPTEADAGAAGAAAGTPPATTKTGGAATEKKQKEEDKLAAGNSSSSSSGGDPTQNEQANGVTVSTTSIADGPSQATRVRAAAIAGAAGGVLIMGLVVRGRRMMDDEGMML